MGTHGRRGLNRLAMGSDAELVLRSAPVPVLMVRDRREDD
jgi:nucleotide-binding universal stress UspA family protein